MPSSCRCWQQQQLLLALPALLSEHTFCSIGAMVAVCGGTLKSRCYPRVCCTTWIGCICKTSLFNWSADSSAHARAVASSMHGACSSST